MRILKIKYLLFLILFLTFSVKAAIALDPDFGWRLRTGFYILENGVPKTDLYSYTMPSFPWVDHAWLTDVIIAFFYRFSGKAGLSTLFSIIFICALFAVGGKNSYSPNFKGLKSDFPFFTNAPFILTSASLLPFFGVRVQILTWLMFAVFLRFLFDKNMWNRYRYLTPFYFLLWANLHGGFSAGLTVLWILIIVRILRTKKIDKSDLLISVAATFTTFINPYGTGVYREIWSSLSDGRLRFQIIEWQPFFMSFDIPSISLIALSFVFILHYRKKFEFEKLLIYLLLLVQGISSVRHFPLWLLMSLPLTTEAFNIFYKESSKNKISSVRFKKVYTYFWYFAVFIFSIQTVFAYKGTYYLSEANFYPQKSLDFVKNLNKPGQIFSDYSWGGYLIWKNPGKRVFIDGRMPSWKQNTGNTSESNDAMGEYLDIVKGRVDFNKYFEKYNIQTVIWPVKKPRGLAGFIEERYANGLNSLYKILNMEKKDFWLTEGLEKNGWTKIYEDKASQVYVR